MTVRNSLDKILSKSRPSWFIEAGMPSTSGDPHYFEFDLDRGIRNQVVEKLEASPLLPFARGVGPAESGVYVNADQEVQRRDDQEVQRS